MKVIVGKEIYVQAAKPERDKQYRNQARDLIKKLRNAVDGKLHYEWVDTEILGEPTSYATVWFDVGEVDPAYDDLIIYFLPAWRGEGHARGEYKHKDTIVWEGKDSIAIWGLPGQDPRTRENAVEEVIKALTRYADTLLHELIHYFDQKRYSKDKGPKTYESKQEYEKYINSPQEFNAYYQQWAARIEKRLDSQILSRYDPGTLNALNAFYYIFGDSAEKFATYHSERGLNDKLRRHFLKRAVQLYNSMYQEVIAEGKQIVDPVSQIKDHHDLVRWLKNVEREVKREFAKEWDEDDLSGRKDLLLILTDFEQFLLTAQDFSKSARDWVVKKLPNQYRDKYLQFMEDLHQDLLHVYGESEASKKRNVAQVIVAEKIYPLYQRTR